jgi:hypothetical protein
LFAVSAVLEGAITLAIMQTLASINPDFIRKPQLNGGRVLGWVGLAALLLAVVGVAVASTHPDGIWKLAGETGIASHAKALLGAPLADYQLGVLQSVGCGRRRRPRGPGVNLWRLHAWRKAAGAAEGCKRTTSF